MKTLQAALIAAVMGAMSLTMCALLYIPMAVRDTLWEAAEDAKRAYLLHKNYKK